MSACLYRFIRWGETLGFLKRRGSRHCFRNFLLRCICSGLFQKPTVYSRCKTTVLSAANDSRHVFNLSEWEETFSFSIPSQNISHFTLFRTASTIIINFSMFKFLQCQKIPLTTAGRVFDYSASKTLLVFISATQYVCSFYTVTQLPLHA